MSVGFAIPSIPPRERLLRRAVKSILRQTTPVDQISIAMDTNREGAGSTRNRALDAINTEWTCFLDDDDEVRPEHVELLLQHANETGADIVYPWFDMLGGLDPSLSSPTFCKEGQEWPGLNYAFPITILGRTELLKAARFPSEDPTPGARNFDWHTADKPFWSAIVDMGGVISHLPARTWVWHHHGANTSGVSDRW